MRVIIPCAGRGTRMATVMQEVPKCLANVAGKTVLEHILTYLQKMDFVEEIRIIVSPEHSDLIFDAIVPMIKANRPFPDIFFIDQPEPLGEGDAIWHGLKCLKGSYSSQPVMIILGDLIPQARSASEMSFLAKFRAHDSEYPPNESIICTKGHLVRNPTNTTVLQLDRDWYVKRFREMRNGKTLPGIHYVRAGIDYIRRGDILFEALDIYKRNKITNAGEFRLTQAYQYLWHHGESFDTAMVSPLHCGTPKGLESAEKEIRR